MNEEEIMEEMIKNYEQQIKILENISKNLN